MQSAMKGDRLVVVAADNTERQKSEMVRVLEKELKKSTQNVVFCEEISLRITKFYQAVKRNFVDIGKHLIVESKFEKIGKEVENSGIMKENNPWQFYGCRWLDMNSEQVDSLSEKAKGIMELVVNFCKVFAWLSCVKHEKQDSNDYDLTFGEFNCEQLSEKVGEVFDLGDMRRLLTKRFIKTVRGSSYEVDLRMAESISLLQNIKNKLLREVVNQLLGLHFASCGEKTWEGESLKVVLTDGLNLHDKSQYEGFLQNNVLLEICKHSMTVPPKISKVIDHICGLIKEKSQLKYIDQKGLLMEINKLESTGNLRPNMNNNQGFCGIRIFEELNYFKLYTFSDALKANSNYMSKDAEDRFDFVGIRLEWPKTLAEIYSIDLARLMEILKGSSEIDMVLLFDENACLRDQIVCKKLMEKKVSKRETILRKMKAIMALVSKQKVCFESIDKIKLKYEKRNTLSKLKLHIKTMVDSKTLSTLKRFASIYHKYSIMGVIRQLLSCTKKLKSGIRLTGKLIYVRRLSCYTEGFMMIQKFGSKKMQTVHNWKIADTLLRNSVKKFTHSALQQALISIKSATLKTKKIQNVLRHLENSQRTKLRRTIRHLGDICREARNQEKERNLERHSIRLLRTNYILNNFLFIFKLKASLSIKTDLSEGYNNIKRASERKRQYQAKVKKLCEKVDRAIKKQGVRLTLGSFSDYKNPVETHNYKLGFHFLELYIKRKIGQKTFGAIKMHLKKKLTCRFIEAVRKTIRRLRLRRGFRRIISVAERKRGLLKLHNLVRYRLMFIRHSNGKILLEGLKKLWLAWTFKMKTELNKISVVLNRCLLTESFSRIKSIEKKVSPGVRLSVIKLELIVLKGIKNSMKIGFGSVHRHLTKYKNYKKHMILVKKNIAATIIQSIGRMHIVRRQFTKMRDACIVIQREWMKAEVRIRLKRIVRRDESSMVNQKKRMTEIKNFALMKLKENLRPRQPNLQKEPQQVPAQTPKIQTKSKSRILDIQDSVMHFSETIKSVPRPNKTPPNNNKQNYHFSKENMFASKQQATMMKLNNEVNNREYIKHYKNRVINNHIKEREKMAGSKQEETPDDSFEYRTDTSTSIDIQFKRDSLYDLIEGVRTKIHQIRRTERNKDGY